MSLQNRFVQIAGSASADCDPTTLRWAHEFVRELVGCILKKGGGVVTTIGSEPHINGDPTLAQVFYWTVLETAHRVLDKAGTTATSNQPRVRVVSSQKDQDRIPHGRTALWSDLRQRSYANPIWLPSHVNAGGARRRKQAGPEVSDALVALGGGEGVEDLAQLYQERDCPVIPLGLSIGCTGGVGNGGAPSLRSDALNRPALYGSNNPGLVGNVLTQLDHNIVTQRTAESAAGIVAQLLEQTIQRRVFFVRLMDNQHQDFADVEQFFSQVVSNTVDRLGYQVIDPGTMSFRQAFTDQEIFDRIHRSLVVVVDLTGLRPNCLIELGYALGRQIPVILTARRGTTLPFDVSTMPTFLWSTKESSEDNVDCLLQFWEQKVGRGAVVKRRN